ncbi:MAG: SpvB/TcaC N-terminal domain-containing protein [Flavobacterium sp.]
MGKILNFCLAALFLPLMMLGQSSETIQLEYDTSGYSQSNQSVAAKIASSTIPVQAGVTDTIPSIKSEMNVNDGGALTYMIPIDVLKGVSNFQPNIALGYSSQSGNGQAGWGWNIIGLSTITRGGRSNYIDGITIGPQYNNSDPFYLDGQRLLATGATTFETEKYSKIKIIKDPSAVVGYGYSFTIQYTDGKVAKYKELVYGQHYISVIKDAYNNEVHFNYSVANNVPQVNSISYGGTSPSTDKFFVYFNYIDRKTVTKTYRSGALYKNTKVLSEIVVQSTYLTANSGVYRKYKLTYDYIQGNTVERLIKVQVQNETGHSLKPLTFFYNEASAAEVVKISRSNTGFPYNAIGLGNVAVGDFTGTGKPYPMYELKVSDENYMVGGSVYNGSRFYFTGRNLQNNKICENDQVISQIDNFIGEVDKNNLASANNLTDEVKFQFNDRVTGFTKLITMNLKGGANQLDDHYHVEWGYEGWFYSPTITLIPGDYVRDKKGRDIISGDYNNDGLVDVIIFEHENLNRPQKFYFSEIGKLPAGQTTPAVLTASGISDESRVFQIEFDGDGLAELMFVTEETGLYSIFKVNLANNSLDPIAGQQNIPLANYTKKTPLIFGDFNGNGLTDFLTPQKVYTIEGSTAAKELEKMENRAINVVGIYRNRHCVPEN